MDVDQSGGISYSEFTKYTRCPHFPSRQQCVCAQIFVWFFSLSLRCRVLGLPDTEYTEHLFHLMDVDESGQIDFREFITGTHTLHTTLYTLHRVNKGTHTLCCTMCCDPSVVALLTGIALMSQTTTEESLKFAFDVFDTNKDGQIEPHEFR